MSERNCLWAEANADSLHETCLPRLNPLQIGWHEINCFLDTTWGAVVAVIFLVYIQAIKKMLSSGLKFCTTMLLISSCILQTTFGDKSTSWVINCHHSYIFCWKNNLWPNRKKLLFWNLWENRIVSFCLWHRLKLDCFEWIFDQKKSELEICQETKSLRGWISVIPCIEVQKSWPQVPALPCSCCVAKVSLKSNLDIQWIFLIVLHHCISYKHRRHYYKQDGLGVKYFCIKMHLTTNTKTLF